jgi:hypothetical protein
VRIIAIKNIVRKDVPIYYRRLYSGDAVLELINKPVEIPVEFQIEHMPTGQTVINVTFPQKVDYPLVPLLKEFRNFIGALDSEGKLPN